MNINRRELPPQPIRVYFKFVECSPELLRLQSGKIYAVIAITDELFGPYPTDIKATKQAWLTKRTAPPSPAGKKLAKQLRTLDETLVSAWNVLLQDKQFITGDMVMQQAGKLPITVLEGQHND